MTTVLALLIVALAFWFGEPVKMASNARKLTGKYTVLPIDKRIAICYTIDKKANETLDQRSRTMTTHITNRKGIKLQLNGDLLTGDTFAMKDFIKTKLDGKWIADQKAWQVNVAKVNWMLENYVLVIDDNPAPVKSSAPYMSYEHFRRSADDPNSDY